MTQDLFPSPPATPMGGAQQNGASDRSTSDNMPPNAHHTPATAGSDYQPPPLRRVEDAYAAAPDSVVANASTSAVVSGGRLWCAVPLPCNQADQFCAERC